jgi:hypothetical protein
MNALLILERLLVEDVNCKVRVMKLGSPARSTMRFIGIEVPG